MKTQARLLTVLCSMALTAFSMPAASADVEDRIEAQTEAQYDAAKKRADMDYEAAKTRCDALDSSAKKTCVKEAKAARESAMADAKVRRKAGEERADTAEDRLEAQYAAAKARRNEMSGSAKDACVEQAKARFQQ